MQAPYIPCTKPQVPFPLFRSYNGSVQAQSTCTFRNKASFYVEVLLAHCPTPKLEGHTLSAVRDCLFNIFEVIVQIRSRSSNRNLRTCHAVLTGTHLTWLFITHISIKCFKLVYIATYASKTSKSHLKKERYF